MHSDPPSERKVTIPRRYRTGTLEFDVAHVQYGNVLHPQPTPERPIRLREYARVAEECALQAGRARA